VIHERTALNTAFIGLPHHVEIMNRYRSRGTVRSDTWSMERFEPEAVLTRARDWIGQSATHSTKC
jgi:hypothetical protein